jgi:hypothetical protein
MKGVNVRRVILGGVVAAVIVFIVAGFLPGVLLSSDLKAWHQSAGSLYTPPPQPIAMIFFTLLSLVFGITAVWIYAGIQPRYGARPRTALLAGFLLWLPGWFTAALGHIALGDYPQYKLTIIPCLCGFVGALLASVAGAAIYRE